MEQLSETPKHTCKNGVCSFELKEEKPKEKCDGKTEVYSRVVGFYRPVQQWNKGKQEEFNDRKEYIPTVE